MPHHRHPITNNERGILVYISDVPGAIYQHVVVQIGRDEVHGIAEFDHAVNVLQRPSKSQVRERSTPNLNLIGIR